MNAGAGSDDPPAFGLIVIGDEILSGKRADRHFAKVLELLQQRALRLAWVQYQPDERTRLTRTLRASFAGTDPVFVCGGIGSTPDDHTRQAAAAALGVELVRHPEAAEFIVQRCRQLAAEGRGSEDMSTAENQQRLTMADFPVGAAIIPNPYNRIAGFAIERHFFVPGFPVMAWPMIEWALETHFARWFHRAPLAERSLVLFDTPESAIAPLMEDVEMRFPGTKSFSLPSVGDGSDGRLARRHIELGVKGPPALLDDAFAWLRSAVARLGAEFDESG